MIATLWLTLLVSCGTEDTLSDGALLRRLSLDLRGVPPSLEELDRGTASKDAWRPLRDEFLEDPALRDRLVGMFAESWHTRVDQFDIEYFDYGLDASLEYPFERAVGEEPLRLMAEVAYLDLPWWNILTVDWTMATDLTASIWPVSYPTDSTGWQRATYTDNRPHAGVLHTNGLWWRYTTTESNVNRERASQITRLLACEDILSRTIAFGEAETDDSTLAEMVHEDPYCLACHSAIDPIASTLFGFWWLSLYSEIEESTYHPERESLWDDYLGIEPAWFGTPVSNLRELGIAIANDQRFYSCTTERMAEALWRRDSTSDDRAVLEELRNSFLESDTSLKALIRGLTETEAYQYGGIESDEGGDRGQRLMSIAQYASSLEALTGFRWEIDGADALDSNDPGFRLLGGGVDGEAIQSPLHLPGVTLALVLERTAQAAAAFLVQGVTAGNPPSASLASLDLASRSGDPAFTDALTHLHLHLFSESPTDEWLEETQTFWESVEAIENAEAAWTSVLSVSLREPGFIAY